MEIEVYKLGGEKLAIIYEGRLFVEAESLGENEEEEDEEEKPLKVKNKKTKKGKSGKLGPEAKEALIAELKKGEKSSQELADEYGLSYAGVHYIKKSAGLGDVQKKKSGGGFAKKNFQCSCGKAFSATVVGGPGETVTCPDDCGNVILASEGEEI